MDTFQGNMHDPMSLHKYMYANANPISNTDPTGLTSLGEMGTALSINNILQSANTLNYVFLLNKLTNAAKEVVVIATISYVTLQLLEAILNGDMLATDLLNEIQVALMELSKTVQEVLKGKKGSIKNADLPPGGPDWKTLLPMTMETVRKLAQKGEPGFKAIWKLLTDQRFNK
jgi:hypothetical protein